MHIVYHIVEGVVGQGGNRQKLSMNNVRKHSILTIGNNDNLCLPRSLVTAKAYVLRGENRKGELENFWQKIRNYRGICQKSEARNLVKKARVVIPATGCGISEIAKFQDYLAKDGFIIKVYNCRSFGKGEKLIFDGSDRLTHASNKTLYNLNILYYDLNSHYEPILSLVGAGGLAKFCERCNRSYKRTHICII